MKSALFAAAALAAAVPSVAHADEVFGGIYAHDLDLVTASGIEEGMDVQLGWRGNGIGALAAIGSPSPYAFVSVNSSGDSHFAAAGLSWKFGQRLYVRPGIGIAVHTNSGDNDFTDGRIDYGSRILFEPEIGVGYEINDRVSLEASWVHLSHAQIFGPQNPGLDTIGVRLNYRFR